MDQNSNGRGVRQFKTALLKHLEQVGYLSLNKIALILWYNSPITPNFWGLYAERRKFIIHHSLKSTWFNGGRIDIQSIKWLDISSYGLEYMELSHKVVVDWLNGMIGKIWILHPCKFKYIRKIKQRGTPKGLKWTFVSFRSCVTCCFKFFWLLNSFYMIAFIMENIWFIRI